MKNRLFRIESDGFNGAWYPAPDTSGRGLIIMLGDSSEDRMARSGAKWLNQQGIHVMAMSPDKKDYGHHNYPLERFGKAILSALCLPASGILAEDPGGIQGGRRQGRFPEAV